MTCMEASTKKQVSRTGVCIAVKKGKGGKKGVAQGHCHHGPTDHPSFLEAAIKSEGCV